MSAFTKTGDLTLQATVSTAASSVTKSSWIDVSGKMGGFFVVMFGRRSATAAGAGANLRLEASSDTSGDIGVPFWQATTDFAACEAEAVSGTVASGTNVVTVASTTNLTAQDLVFIDNGTIGNSEWGRVKTISANTSITLEDNLVNAQTGATIYDSAEIYNAIALPEGAMRVRLVVDASLFTQASAARCKYSTIDGIA